MNLSYRVGFPNLHPLVQDEHYASARLMPRYGFQGLAATWVYTCDPLMVWFVSDNRHQLPTYCQPRCSAAEQKPCLGSVAEAKVNMKSHKPPAPNRYPSRSKQRDGYVASGLTPPPPALNYFTFMDHPDVAPTPNHHHVGTRTVRDMDMDDNYTSYR